MTEMALTTYRKPLPSVSSFKYLGIVLLESHDNWPAVIRNLRRVRQKWAILSWVIGQEGADTHKLGMFYTMAVQAVLFYR